jgi:hypothetical protein
VEVATLVIAVIGVFLAGLSLAWQAATFLLTAPRVKVSLREGFRGPLGIMLGPPSLYTEAGRAVMEQQGYIEHVLAIEAINHGRFPATVKDWSVRFGNGAAYGNPADPLNPELPYRLDPFNSAIWYAPVEHLQALQGAFTDQGDDAASARGEVDLGTRKTIRSGNALVITPDGTRVPTARLTQRVVRKALRHASRRT